MKSRVRYGTQTTAKNSVGAFSSNSRSRAPAGHLMVDGNSQSDEDMIEEYKLEDQHHLVNSLGPYYEGTSLATSQPSANAADRRSTASSTQPSSSSSAAAFRCFLSSASSSSSSNSGSGKPALRTVSIMETLNELTGATSTASGQNPSANSRLAISGRSRVPVPSSASVLSHGDSSEHVSGPGTTNIVQRRKKTPHPPVDRHVSALFADQWKSYGKLQPTGPPVQPHSSRAVLDVPSAAVKRLSLGDSQHRERAWDVSRLGSKLGLTGRKGRSVDDILASQIPTAAVKSRDRERERENANTASTGNTHGYGSLERRRRRRPGTRAAFALSARRGETDWEREEDEEDESFVMMSPPILRSPTHATFKKDQESAKIQSMGSLAPMATGSVQRERREAPARLPQAYKQPTEWFKKKRTPAQLPLIKATRHSAQERGQTPDWIHKIFHVARRGNLLKLQRVVAGMEPTLVRNLSDHRGNNLLHVLAGAGNADALAWLCSSFGPEMQDALLDENKRGLTPVVAAIQAGRLEALQFLVDQTSARERLAPVDSDRSLLHIAAKYGKVDLVAWLAQFMESQDIDIDLRDHCGNTPLHLAARAGHASAVAILVAHGADVTAKNDMGHRALDLASAHGHIGVAQLLRLHDAALGLSIETLEANEELENVRGDYAELKSYFRDVLVIGKRLAKERDEMCRQLGRLYEDATSLHQGLLIELRALHRELAATRTNHASRKTGEMADRTLDETVAVVEALHERWQNQQRSWFSSSLADMEHRLLIAEDGWKRLRTSNPKHRSCQIQPHELLRNRLAAVNAQSSSIQCDVPMSSSTEGSLYSGCCNSASASDAEAEHDSEPANPIQQQPCNTCFSTSAIPAPASVSGSYSSANRPNHLSIKHPLSALPVAPKGSNHGRNLINSDRDVSYETDSVYSTLQAAVRKIGAVVTGDPPSKELISPSSVGREMELKSDRRSGSNRKKSQTRQELRKRLQEVKLTSESGNASVIEVIEPSSSEGEDDPPTNCGRPQDQSTPIRNFPNARSFNASFSEELEKARQSKNGSRQSGVESSTKGTVLSSTSNVESLGLAEPDLLAGTALRGPETGTAPTRSDECGLLTSAEHEADTEADYDQIIVGSSTRSSSSLSNVMSSMVPRKKTGFLTKFALKARWPSKRKPPGSEAVLSTESQSSDSPDLSIEDSTLRDICDRDDVTDGDGKPPGTITTQSSSSAGVVAGLSQMFEDMSKTRSVTSSAPAASSNGPMAEKRGPSRNSANSAGIEDISDSLTRGNKSGATNSDFLSHGHEGDMNLPSASSPPPVPIEIETYHLSAASSQPETVSSHSDRSISNPHRLLHPPPPPRFSSHLSSSKSSGDLSKVGVGPTSSLAPASASSSSSSTSASTSVHGGVESLSVAASEDSGIVVARPASSASKSDTSRPAPATYAAFTVFKTSSVAGFPLRKASSVSGELPTPDSSMGSGERLSPAPSDLSKTESALSPPSHASDLSKTESMRHFRQLARIEETTHMSAASRNAEGSSGTGISETVTSNRDPEKERDPTTSMSKAESVVKVASVVDVAAQSGQILTWREAKLKNQVVTPPPLEERHLKGRVRLEEKSGLRTLKKRQISERPWYDVSDDESDLLSPERLTKLKTSRSSSEEEMEV